MAYLLYRISAIFVGFVIYAGFGILCAFLYLALEKSPQSPSNIETSTALSEFLSSSSAKKTEFTWKQINDGIFTILLDCASSKTKGGARASMPCSPRAVYESANSFSLEIPVSATSPVGDFSLAMRFILSYEKGLPLDALFIGSARIPRFFANPISNAVMSSYTEIDGIDAYISAISKIGVSDATPERIIISK